MARSKIKGPFLKKEQIQKNIILNKNLIILPEYLNKRFNIYNGKMFINKQINESMIGYKFGEFISTRKQYFYKKK